MILTLYSIQLMKKIINSSSLILNLQNQDLGLKILEIDWYMKARM